MGIKHRADSDFRKIRLLASSVSGGQLSASKCPTFHTRNVRRHLKKIKILYQNLQFMICTNAI